MSSWSRGGSSSGARAAQEADYVFFGNAIGSLYSQKSDGRSNGRGMRAGEPRRAGRDNGRLHGAFTGGFSAGYFNTVGSKEGWAPSSFRSSRNDKTRTDANVIDEGNEPRTKNDARGRSKFSQSVEDFMDDDELEERRRATIEASDMFDTFGTSRRTHNREKHLRGLQEQLRDGVEENEMRLNTNPGRQAGQREVFLSDNRVADLFFANGKDGLSTFSNDSIGRKIMHTMKIKRNKMRRKRALKNDNNNAASISLFLEDDIARTHHEDEETSRFYDQAALISLTEKHQRIMNRRKEQASRGLQFGEALHGIGYNAKLSNDQQQRQDYRNESYQTERKRKSGAMTTAFGSILEENDIDVYNDDNLDDTAKERLLALSYDAEPESKIDAVSRDSKLMLPSASTPLLLSSDASHTRLSLKMASFSSDVSPFEAILDFVEAKCSDANYSKHYYPPPKVPSTFNHRRVFRSIKVADFNTIENVEVVEAPHDEKIRKAIETLAIYVAKTESNSISGENDFENLAREKERNNSTFSFLFGGYGSEYYKYRVSLARKLHKEPKNLPEQRTSKKVMDANDRAALLGEIDDEVHKRRKDKTKMALVSRHNDAKDDAVKNGTNDIPLHRDGESTGTDGMQKRSNAPALPANLAAFAATLSERFQKGGVQTASINDKSDPSSTQPKGHDFISNSNAFKIEPNQRQAQQQQKVRESVGRAFREYEEFHPAPLLCKRFNVRDPYRGKSEQQKYRDEQQKKILSKFKSNTFHLQTSDKEELHIPPSSTSNMLRTSDSVKSMTDNFLSTIGIPKDGTPANYQTDAGEDKLDNSVIHELVDIEAEAIINKPLDLFKAIFEDTSDDETLANEYEAPVGQIMPPPSDTLAEQGIDRPGDPEENPPTSEQIRDNQNDGRKHPLASLLRDMMEKKEKKKRKERHKKKRRHRDEKDRKERHKAKNERRERQSSPGS